MGAPALPAVRRRGSVRRPATACFVIWIPDFLRHLIFVFLLFCPPPGPFAPPCRGVYTRHCCLAAVTTMPFPPGSRNPGAAKCRAPVLTCILKLFLHEGVTSMA